jgi:hypothetical protein
MINMKRLFRSFRALRISLSYKFMIGIGVVLAMTMGTSFHYISLKHEALIFEQMDMQARAFFTQIIHQAEPGHGHKRIVKICP